MKDIRRVIDRPTDFMYRITRPYGRVLWTKGLLGYIDQGGSNVALIQKDCMEEVLLIESGEGKKGVVV